MAETTDVARSGMRSVPRWRRLARKLAHLVGATGRRHARRVVTDRVHMLAGGVLRWRPLRPVGRAIHRRIIESPARRPDSLHTFFRRNRPLLEQIRGIASIWPGKRTLMVASIGCSTGAELYSVLDVVQRERPGLHVRGIGVDIEPEALRRAAAAHYRREDQELSQLADAEIDELFVRDGSGLAVAPRIAAAAEWREADVIRDDLREIVGHCDIAIANSILCHLPPAAAEAALRNIIRAIAPGGYLVCYGMDIELRSRVVTELGLTPLSGDPQPTYVAEPRAIWKWPFAYWAQEPFDRSHPDAAVRYASVFMTKSGAPE